MTVQMLINELSKVEDKNRKVVISNILRSPFNHANVKAIEGSSFGASIYIVAESQ